MMGLILTLPRESGPLSAVHLDALQGCLAHKKTPTPLEPP